MIMLKDKRLVLSKEDGSIEIYEKYSLNCLIKQKVSKNSLLTIIELKDSNLLTSDDMGIINIFKINSKKLYEIKKIKFNKIPFNIIFESKIFAHEIILSSHENGFLIINYLNNKIIFKEQCRILDIIQLKNYQLLSLNLKEKNKREIRIYNTNNIIQLKYIINNSKNSQILQFEMDKIIIFDDDVNILIFNLITFQIETIIKDETYQFSYCLNFKNFFIFGKENYLYCIEKNFGVFDFEMIKHEKEKINKIIYFNNYFYILYDNQILCFKIDE